MLLNCGVGEDSWALFGLQRKSNQSILMEVSPEYSFERWMLSWNSNTLAIWCEELTHWKRPWCWERLRAGGEGDDTGWDGWMASPTQWTWVWVSSGSWWWTGKPSVLQSMGSQRVRHDWVTEVTDMLVTSSAKAVMAFGVWFGAMWKDFGSHLYVPWANCQWMRWARKSLGILGLTSWLCCSFGKSHSPSVSAQVSATFTTYYIVIIYSSRSLSPVLWVPWAEDSLHRLCFSHSSPCCHTLCVVKSS